MHGRSGPHRGPADVPGRVMPGRPGGGPPRSHVVRPCDPPAMSSAQATLCRWPRDGPIVIPLEASGNATPGGGSAPCGFHRPEARALTSDRSPTRLITHTGSRGRSRSDGPTRPAWANAGHAAAVPGAAGWPLQRPRSATGWPVGSTSARSCRQSGGGQLPRPDRCDPCHDYHQIPPHGPARVHTWPDLATVSTPATGATRTTCAPRAPSGLLRSPRPPSGAEDTA